MDDPIREALKLLERPVEPPEGVADALFARLLEEIEEERALRPAEVPPRPRRIPRRVLVPAFAVLGVVALITGVLVFLPRPPSALAVLQEARQQFGGLPPYHATTQVQANDDSTSPDYDVEFATEDWLESHTRWRSTITAAPGGSFGSPGDFRVFDGKLLGQYKSDSNIFFARPAEEIGDPKTQSPAFFFDPSLQWWSTGFEQARPSDEFFAERCRAASTKFLGRAAQKLTCPASGQPRDIEIWVDDETGMLLKIVTFEVIREIKGIEFRPEFPAGIFDVTAPEGAKKGWEGKGPPPPEYAAPAGPQVTATIEIGPNVGLGLEVGKSSLWVTRYIESKPTETTSGGLVPTELLRVDPKTRKVGAAIPLPEPGGQVRGVQEDRKYVWITYVIGRGDSFTQKLRRLDLGTNSYVGEPIDVGEPWGGGMALAEGALWLPAGKSRSVKFGDVETRYVSLSRVDLATLQVESIEFDGGVVGRPVYEAGSLWVGLHRLNPRTRESEYFIVRMDPKTRTTPTEIPVGNQPPNFMTGGESAVWATVAGEGPNLFDLMRIDPSTGQTSRVGIGTFDDVSGFGLGGGFAWVGKRPNELVKIDPRTLQTVGTIAVGRGGGSIVYGFGFLWVTNFLDGTLMQVDIG